MEKQFRLSCESTVDLPYSYVSGRDIPVIFYTYTVDGEERTDDMGRVPGAMEEFYREQREGKNQATSQINTYRYEEYFEQLLQEEEGDILHIAMGSGMSRSVFNACQAAENLKEKYPDREVRVIDSLGSTVGYGLLVDMAADLRDAGASLDQIEAFALANRNRIHHQFFSTDLTQYRRSGRVSGPAATVGSVLGLCPLMHLNCDGAIIAYDKVRGKKKAIARTAETVMAHIEDGQNYKGKLFLAHSDCPDLIEELRQALIPSLGDVAANAPVYDIGTIIAVHCGPGTVLACFLGDERTED